MVYMYSIISPFAYVTQERRLWWSMVLSHFMTHKPPVTHTKWGF